MAGLFELLPRGPAGRDHAGQNLRGEGPLSAPRNLPEIVLSLSAEEADVLHSDLERALDSGFESGAFGRLYRLLGWRLLAAGEPQEGLVGRMSELAREAKTLEEFEAARDEELGPIIGGLENPENRDP